MMQKETHELAKHNAQYGSANSRADHQTALGAGDDDGGGRVEDGSGGARVVDAG